VSVQTASDILNCGRHDRYDPETQERVRQTAQKQQYRPQRMGRVMRNKMTGIVGFVAANVSPDDGQLEHYGVYPFLVGMSHYLTIHDYHVGLVEIAEFESDDKQELPQSLQERFYDGLVIHWGLAERFREIMPRLKIPAVWWDAGLFAPTNCLDRDEAEVGRVITDRLIQLGHRQIGFMVGKRSWEGYQRGQPPHYSYAQRYESYESRLHHHGLQAVPVVGYDVEAISAQLVKHKLTAVITLSAASVPVVQLAARELGWRVPQDLSVAVCDFEARMRGSEVRVGGMSYDRYAVGRQAAEMLLQLLKQPRVAVASQKFTGEFRTGETISSAPVR
jgi:DNA-binding LacI/PurR family transcriptional regulator